MDIKKFIKNRYVLLSVGLAVLIAVFLIAQAIIGSKHTITGTFTLSSSGADFSEGKSCYGDGGYDDIYEGTTVTIKDNSDDIIAVSKLANSKAKNSSTCVFTFTVEDVPNSSIYQIEVAKRGDIVYSDDELKKRDYKVETTLGD